MNGKFVAGMLNAEKINAGQRSKDVRFEQCKYIGSILREMCGNSTLYRTLEASSAACALAILKLSDAHFVLHTKAETPSGADAPDLPERKSVEASVVNVYLLCIQTLVQPFCTVHWKRPVLLMQRLYF